MSAKQLLNSHLDDYVVLLEHLLTGFSRHLNGNNDYQSIIKRLVDKDRYIQESLEQLIAHQAFQARITSVKNEIKQLDSTIVSFGHQLAELEQRLYEGVSDERTLKNLDGVITKQPFSLDEVLVFAEKLACMSFGPADYREWKGMNPMRYHRPHPDDNAIAKSALQYGLDDLVEFARQNKAAENAEPVDSDKQGAQESLSLSAENTTFDPNAPVNAIVPPKDWKAPVRKRPAAVAVSKVAEGLELDLNPDLSSDEDDDFGDVDDFDSD